MIRMLCLLPALCALAAWLDVSEPVLIYNRTPSVPVGFYIRDARPIEIGSFVTVSARLVAPEYARSRVYDDDTDRFLKRVAAVGGDYVCARGQRVEVGDTLVLRRHSVDSAGRSLPAWSGCRLLRADEVLLVGDAADSFDGRYWGPVRIDFIDSAWRPVELF